MDECVYSEIVANTDTPSSEHERRKWKPLMRQCLICAGVWALYMMQGLFLGTPTVLLAQTRRDENVTVTDEMASWISSMPVISAEPLVVILPWLFYRIGRKLTFTIVCTLSFIGFIIFYISTNMYYILLAQLFLGSSVAAANTFLPITVAEYTSPKYRGIFLTAKSATAFWGIWIANAIGTFYHWKNIALVAFVCSVYIMVSIFAWPESPYWLARKGRYVECAKSHRWLKGTDESSEKELAILITTQKKSRISALSKENESIQCFSFNFSSWSIITSRSFYKPTLACIVLFAQYQFSGKYIITMYAIDVLKKITNDESVAYKAMLTLDGFTVFSMYGGCLLSRYFKRRTLILLLSSTGIIFLYIMSFYLYAVSLSIIAEDHIVIISLLSVYSVAIGCGPIVLSTSIYGEIIPSRFQTPVMIIAALYNLTVTSTLLKLSPFMMRTLTIQGYFLFFAVSSTFIIILLFIYLPETKDKTVYEIEEWFKGPRILEKQRNILLNS